MSEVLPILLLVCLVAAAVTAAWNGYEAHQLRESRAMDELVLAELKTVINGNADVMVTGFQYMEGMQNNLTMRLAKSELYDLALSIRRDYPDATEKFKGDVLKLE